MRWQAKSSIFVTQLNVIRGTLRKNPQFIAGRLPHYSLRQLVRALCLVPDAAVAASGRLREVLSAACLGRVYDCVLWVRYALCLPVRLGGCDHNRGLG